MDASPKTTFSARRGSIFAFLGRGGIKRGFCGGRLRRPPQNPSFHPLPSPAAEGERERGGGRGRGEGTIF
jgi:hypothetical protein